MRLILLCVQLAVRALSETQLAPPQDVHVQGDLLTWTPATEDADVVHTVQYKGFSNKLWENVPACVATSRSSCNVSDAKAADGCVRLRVQARRRQLKSASVEACSPHGDACTPAVSLTVRPGSLTVNLSRNHTWAQKHGGHSGHTVYYGKEGEEPQGYEHSTTSVSLNKLEEGQRYCVTMEYTLYHKAAGPGSCSQCVVIPESENRRRQTATIAAVATVGVLMPVGILAAYVILYHRKRVKQCMRPPCEIPDHFMLRSGLGHRLLSTSGTAESFDVPAVVEARTK